MKTKLWFKRKIYGWGWTPSTWQGYLSTITYVILTLAPALIETQYIKEHTLCYTGYVALLTAALIAICYKKGEKPRWQWGKKTPQNSD